MRRIEAEKIRGDPPHFFLPKSILHLYHPLDELP
jgi:hypothetical protein